MTVKAYEDCRRILMRASWAVERIARDASLEEKRTWRLIDPIIRKTMVQNLLSFAAFVEMRQTLNSSIRGTFGGEHRRVL